MVLMTGIKGLDRLGGLPKNSIIEICGKAASGKTIFSHQFLTYFLLHNPKARALFFDVDLSFHPELIHKILRKFNRDLLLKNVLKRILIVSAPESVERVIKILEKNLGKYELILIDSVSSLFKEPLDEIGFKEYMGNLIGLGMELRKHSRFSTILVTNQMRSIIRSSFSDDNLIFDELWYAEGVIPALGKIWEYFVDLRIYMKKLRKNMGVMIIAFSNSLPETFSPFKYVDGFLE